MCRTQIRNTTQNAKVYRKPRFLNVIFRQKGGKKVQKAQNTETHTSLVENMVSDSQEMTLSGTNTAQMTLAQASPVQSLYLEICKLENEKSPSDLTPDEACSFGLR